MNLFKKANPGIHDCTPVNLRDLLDALLRYLGVTEADSGSSAAVVTTGDEFPADTSKRVSRVHFLRDSNNQLVSIQVFAAGIIQTYHTVVQNEVRHFPASLKVPGWSVADGTKGTLNLKDELPDFFSPHPDGLLIAQQYVGF